MEVTSIIIFKIVIFPMGVFKQNIESLLKNDNAYIKPSEQTLI